MSGALGLSCRDRDDLDGRRRPIPGLDRVSSPYQLSLAGKQPVFDLYDNRAAAVVHAHGAVVIECGSADMAKYVEGGYRSAWHLHATDGAAGGAAATRPVALFDGLGGTLHIPIDGHPGGVARASDGSITITVRARSAMPEQLVSVFLNEHRLGDIAMPKQSWQRYQIRAPADAVEAGENQLRFYFRHRGEIDARATAAALARVRVGAPGPVDEPALTARSIERGGGRLDALSTDGPSRLSYYVTVPASQPALAFAYAQPAAVADPGPAAAAGEPGSAGEQAANQDSATGQGAEGEGANGALAGAALAVRVTAATGPDGDAARASAGGGAGVQLWAGRAGAAWRQATVDLSDHAGQLVRLDLISDGPVDWGRPQLLSAPSPAPAPALSELRSADHIIVWVVSALRADRVFGGEVPTPGFHTLAERGVSFPHAHSASPSPSAAHVALLSGRFPRGERMPEGIETLAERLTRAGYATALISGNGFVNDERGFARGFGVYENPMRRRHPFHARVLWQRARRVLQRHLDGQSFLYVVTVEPHLPYRPSSDSLAAEWSGAAMRFEPTDTIALAEAVSSGRETLTADECAYITALYDAEVRDADAAFGEMLRDLEQLGVAERTAVVLVSDHGEELWERGGFGHGGSLHQELTHVPLVVAPAGSLGPGGERAVSGCVDSAASTIDLHATVLGLAGLAAGPRVQGRDLLASDGASGLRACSPASVAPDSWTPPAGYPRAIFGYLPGQARSVIVGRHKLIVPTYGRPQLYDLASDPDERADRYGQRPLVERYLRTVFGIGVGYETAWSRQRWGQPNNLQPAFSADHGP